MEERKIIIIEADPDHSELILDEYELEKNNWEVVLMKDGREIIDYLQKTEAKGYGKEQSIVISQIILDLYLPEICGMDILEFIKKSPMYSSIQAVILSYITKPFSYDEFVEQIRVLKRCC